ncbi:MAG: hypothetical protein JSR99_04975 [Proteobacteria bacterium]|nr:hypothetical protein [Pseudomonadota bacterium]
MAFFVTFGAVPAAIGQDHPTLESALEEACRLINEGEKDVAIQSGDGRSISGDVLIRCCGGEEPLGEHLFK